MFEANNPEIDVRHLAARVDLELERPPYEHGRTLATGSGETGEADTQPARAGGGQPAPPPPPAPAGRLVRLKQRLRRVPVLGPALVRANAWQRRVGLRRRVHATPLLGFALRWAKSLRLLNRTRQDARTALERTDDIAGQLAQFNWQIGTLRNEFASLSARMDWVDGGVEGTDGQTQTLARREESLRAFVEDAFARIEDLKAEVDSVTARVESDLRAHFDGALRGTIEDFTARLEEVKDDYRGRDDDVASQVQQLAERQDDLRRHIDGAIQGTVSDFTARLEGVKGEYRGRDEELSSLLREFGERLHRLADRADLLHGDVLFQQRRLDKMLAQGPAPAKGDAALPASSASGASESHVPNRFDQFYEAFEDRFRGRREEIKQRQQVYLEAIREARAGTAARPVLDIGCGRGEWLELLGEQDLTAYGIDINAMAVEACRGHGLDAREADMMAHLADCEDAALGAITAFHLIEHLPVDTLLALLDEARRTLAPDGVLILETPNPENLIVGAHTFHNDPTHRAPIPPSVARFMAEQRGFTDVRIRRLHPNESVPPLPEEGEIGRRLNELLYGPQDYAVIARRP